MQVLRCFNTVFPLWSLRTSSNKEKKKGISDKSERNRQGKGNCARAMLFCHSRACILFIFVCFGASLLQTPDSFLWMKTGERWCKIFFRKLDMDASWTSAVFLGDKIHLCSLSEPNSGFLSCSQWYDRLAELKGVQRENPAWRWRVYREWGWGSLEQYVHSIVTIFGDTSVWSFSFTK